MVDESSAICKDSTVHIKCNDKDIFFINANQYFCDSVSRLISIVFFSVEKDSQEFKM